MKIHPAIVVATAVVFLTTVVALGFFIITVLQGAGVLLELIARSLEETTP